MYFHASPVARGMKPGDMVEPGHPPNFGEVPLPWVYFSDNLESAEFWAEFLGGESMADKLGYFPDVVIFEVEPTGEMEPDPWCLGHDIFGCFRAVAPLKVVRVDQFIRGE
jgi:hypothetical protein